MNAGAGRFIADGILRLLLGAHKKHGFAVGRQIAHEHIRFLQLADRFLQVDDINAVALRKNIRGHFGVPAAGLVSEVDAGLQQLLHGYDCHNAKSSLVFPPQVLEEQQIYPSIRGNRLAAAPAAAQHLRAFCRNSIPYVLPWDKRKRKFFCCFFRTKGFSDNSTTPLAFTVAFLVKKGSKNARPQARI